jgi:hypothetical protein
MKVRDGPDELTIKHPELVEGAPSPGPLLFKGEGELLSNFEYDQKTFSPHL